ncbi:MAG: hypothetical protein JWL77_1705 [Chthonomonadaceae bacterium]|nr:hypothetical protein [Chthonomonadaceae bacterium]
MEQKHRRSRMRSLILGLIVGGLAVAGGWYAWPRERLLTDAAHSVAEIDNGPEQFAWISADQLVVVSTTQRGGENFENGDPINWHGSADLLNVTTRKRERLTAFTDLLNRTTTFPLVDVSDFEASPDGNWLLWQTYKHRDDLSAPRAAKLDGSHFRAWESNRYEETFFADSHHLCQLTSEGAILRDLWNPEQDSGYLRPDQTPSLLAPFATQRPLFANIPYSQRLASTGTVEIDRYRTEDRALLHFSWTDPKNKVPWPEQVVKLKLPAYAKLLVETVSPQQQSIVYHLNVSYTPPLLSWLHRMLPKFAVKTTETEELWVSRTDGQGMHKIGYLPFRPGDANAYTVLEHLRWLPDGEQISFIHRGKLYVMSAKPDR